MDWLVQLNPGPKYLEGIYSRACLERFCSFYLSWKPLTPQSLFNGGQQRTQCTNSRTDQTLTISTPLRSSVKTLSDASPRVLFTMQTLFLSGACVASACRVTAALLRQCCTFCGVLRGAIPALCLWSTLCMCGILLCASMCLRGKETNACQDMQMKQITS